MEYQIDQDVAQQLQNEYDILHLLYSHNKNQFHSKFWWNKLQQLHQLVRKILTLNQNFSNYQIIFNKKAQKFQKLRKKTQFIEKFNREKIDPLVKKFENCTNYLLKEIIPKCWRNFHGILSEAQFITLGFSLLGSLAKINDLLSNLRRKFEKRSSINKIKSNKAQDSKQEIIEEEVSNWKKSGNNDDNSQISNKKKDSFNGTFKAENKSKKRKKNNSFFNDLFGDDLNKKKKKMRTKI